LERVSLVAAPDTLKDTALVSLMTVHSAKGLEFKSVFLTGMEETIFPYKGVDQTHGESNEELDEERRLAYVGLTRAQHRLYLSRAVTRSAWGSPMSNPASRFLADVPESLVHWRRVDPGRAGPVERTVFGRRADVTGNDSAQAGVAARGLRSTPFRGWQDTPVLALEVGDRVTHDKYGLGTVVATDGTGPRATATIDFGSSGTVRLMLIGGVPLVKL